jgi:hypothetical protein
VELYPNHSSEIAHYPYRGEIAAKMPRISPWVMTTQIGNLLRMNPVDRDWSVDVAGGKLGVKTSHCDFPGKVPPQYRPGFAGEFAAVRRSAQNQRSAVRDNLRGIGNLLTRVVPRGIRDLLSSILRGG